jgi:glycosyltransferase involved in cell wall biosynthesis
VEEILLSLVVPIYNGGQYIDHLFHQFDDQDMEGVELVCVDDGSRDDSYQQLLRKAETAAFAVCVHHQDNAGASAARNAGVQQARGKFVAFLDVDDGITPDYIRTLKQYMQEDRDLLVFSSMRVQEGFQRQNHPEKENTVLTKDEMLRRFWSDPTRLGVYNLLIKRQYMLEHQITSPVGYKYYEDYDLLFQLFAQTDSIRCLDKVMYYYILRAGSAMGTFNAERVNCLDLMYRRGQWLETAAPVFAPMFRKWGTPRLYWSVLWQAALAFPAYRDFSRFAEATHARQYLRKLSGYPDWLLKISTIVFLCSRRAYHLAVRLVGTRKSKVQPVKIETVLETLVENPLFY